MGNNPYIEADAPPPPSKAYVLTVVLADGSEVDIAVDPEELPEADDGNYGSVLSILLANGVEIDHTCGGVCACSTCHVYIESGLSSSPDPIEEEEDQLDFAPAVQHNSRLACQFVPNGSQNVKVKIPDWNRNEVSEDH